MSDEPEDPKGDAAAQYAAAAASKDDPYGDRAFVKARSETREKPKPRAERKTKVTTQPEETLSPAELEEAKREAERLKKLRDDVNALQRVDLDALVSEEAKLARGEYDLAWTPGDHGLPPHCPVTPLGIKRSTFFFLSPLNELVDLAAGNFGQAHMDALFAPQTGYALAMWGATSQKSGGKRIKYEGMRRNLMDACARKGVFDPADKVRGRGAWKGDDGKLILHHGDVVLVNGVEETPGVFGDFVYPARPRLATPLGDGLESGRAAAKKLLLWLECWPWRRGALDARFMLGWIVASLLGAAIDWRPQVMLTGDSGMGKSTLNHLIKGVLGDRILDVADASAAGLYQTLGYDALGVAFDEFENEDDAKGAAVLRLARLASSGGRVTRGGADGVPTNYQARGAFMFSAINPPAMRPAEQNRTTLLALRKPAEGAKPPLFSAQEADDVGRQLIARLIHMWSFWPERLDYFREQLAVLKHSNRGQDQFGTLLAAADLVLYEGDPEAEGWAEIRDQLAPEEMGETSGALPNWRRCLNHVLAYQPETWRHYKHKSIGAGLAAFDNPNPGDDDDDKKWSQSDLQQRLAHVGLGFVTSRAASEEEFGRSRWLAFPLRHPALAKAFEQTDWSARRGADGAWIGAICQAPDEVWKRDVFRVNGARERGVLVRLDAVLEPDDEKEKGNA